MPGFTVTAELSSDTGELPSAATGATWQAIRTLDDKPLVLKVIQVSDAVEAQTRAAQLMAVLGRMGNTHLVGLHGAIPLAGGALAMVFDRVVGGSLAQLLTQRGNLSAGETVTTVAPLFGALADLHAAGAAHGDLAPRKILFSPDGRPQISGFGVARLRAPAVDRADRDESFMAPEVVGGASPSSASDVYSMAALGWFCLTGAPPGPASTRRSSFAGRCRVPARLIDVLTSCLATNPNARPSARAAAIEVFDAAPAESVILTSVADPATEITRRIRATAAAVPVSAPPSTDTRLPRSLVFGAFALLTAISAGTIWLVGHTTDTVRPAAALSGARSGELIPSPATTSTSSEPTATAMAPAATTTAIAPAATTTATASVSDVVTARDSPRTAAAGLLQALVDARALAYTARNPVLLDLVYAPGATKASADRSNLATALQKGATYLGLSFVVTDAAFLDGTADTARVRATIVTPAYETGQPDGRTVAHAQDTVGPSVFTLSLTQDGWRILGLTLA